MAIDFPAQSVVESILHQKMQNIYSQQQAKYSTVTMTPQPESIEWAKFAMWLRGFLGALEGKELSAGDVEKIMEKLSTVDPESQNWRYPQQPQPLPYPGFIPAPLSPTIGPPPVWTYSTTTTNARELEDFIDSCKDTTK